MQPVHVRANASFDIESIKYSISDYRRNDASRMPGRSVTSRPVSRLNSSSRSCSRLSVPSDSDDIDLPNGNTVDLQPLVQEFILLHVQCKCMGMMKKISWFKGKARRFSLKKRQKKLNQKLIRELRVSLSSLKRIRIPNLFIKRRVYFFKEVDNDGSTIPQNVENTQTSFAVLIFELRVQVWSSAQTVVK